ncbi:phage holin family protein [Moheibacter sediminis]|uniref:Putative Holin-X, holin superfamily III n=1 Tax=Moheibacter sediminis TaxID=1434700 RepID=A0A1W2ADT1_9FLAO|nr:phage holin family protein [Moheibacter sediminis]SMC58826.1 Putative Holin-X, holin superfamily III [Moheibacter sediminis]
MFDDLKQYINNRISYAKLEIVDSVSNMIGAGVFGMLVGVFVLMILFIGSLAAGFLLGNWFDDTGLGFLFVMIVYVLLLVIFIIFRKKIQLIITNKTIEAAMEAIDNSDDDDED